MSTARLALPSTQTGPETTFADVLRAVEEAPELTPGVRGNMRSSVIRCAQLVGSHRLAGVVDVQLIAKRLERITPAKLGFKSPGSLAAFQSNLRRALRLAGITVMPGRHRNPLQPGWAKLASLAQAQEDGFLWPALSRFVHYLSCAGIAPAEVSQAHFIRFGHDLRTTCLGSKANQVVRNTARAWKRAQAIIPGWPTSALVHEPRKSDVRLLPWSAFPASFKEDARRFVNRDDDWLSTEVFSDEGLRRPLRPTTKSNYLEGLRRVASILVALGTSPANLKLLADLVELRRAKDVLHHVSQRTGRTQGGHVMFLALLLYIVARDHAGVDATTTAKLAAWFKKTRPDSVGMSDQTLQRFVQFDDPAVLDRLVRLPGQLMAAADKAPVPDISSAKLARLALYLALLLDTCARSGNIVGLDLQAHVITSGGGKAERTFVIIPAHEVKNGQEIRAELSGATGRMLRHYVDRYRGIHGPGPSPWLFPRQDGTHWSTTQACTDLNDVAARRLGVDVTPHLMRSLAGKIMLDAHPGAIAAVQQLLGHKRLDTTLRFYARFDPQKARAQYHQVLETRRESRV